MKILKINKSIDIDTLKDDLSNYEFYDGNFKIPHNTVRGIEKIILAKFKIDINSRLAQYNIKIINESLTKDEESIEYILKHFFNRSLELLCPGLSYKHYLSYGLEYNTKMVNGKVVRKVKKSENLNKAISEYYISIWPDLFINTLEPVFAIVLEPVAEYAGKLIFDYETINSYIPDFVKKLVELEYADVAEDGYEIDEELRSIIVECANEEQARKLVQNRYPNSKIHNVTEIK